jgi:hypothetical protein
MHQNLTITRAQSPCRERFVKQPIVGTAAFFTCDRAFAALVFQDWIDNCSMKSSL